MRTFLLIAFAVGSNGCRGSRGGEGRGQTHHNMDQLLAKAQSRHLG